MIVLGILHKFTSIAATCAVANHKPDIDIMTDGPRILMLFHMLYLLSTIENRLYTSTVSVLPSRQS